MARACVPTTCICTAPASVPVCRAGAGVSHALGECRHDAFRMAARTLLHRHNASLSHHESMWVIVLTLANVFENGGQNWRAKEKWVNLVAIIPINQYSSIPDHNRTLNAVGHYRTVLRDLAAPSLIYLNALGKMHRTCKDFLKDSMYQG